MWTIYIRQEKKFQLLPSKYPHPLYFPLKASECPENELMPEMVLLCLLVVLTRSRLSSVIVRCIRAVSQAIGLLNRRQHAEDMQYIRGYGRAWADGLAGYPVPYVIVPVVCHHVRYHVRFSTVCVINNSSDYL